MNMKQLKYVIVLSEHNNFTRAADELEISQPSLSQYIKNIEKQLGTELFYRVGQDVRLTDAGMEYLRLGKEILRLENELQSRLTDISEDVAGSITVGIAPYRSAGIMPSIINKFRKLYGGISIVLVEQKTAELKESAEKGKLDLCISTMPIDQKLFSYYHLMNEETVLAIPKAMCADLEIDAIPSYGRLSISVCRALPLVSLPQSQLMGKSLYNLCDKHGISPLIAVECQSLSAVHSMVAAGVGAALLPYSLVKQNENTNVNYYLLKEQTESREIIAFHRKDRYVSKPMETLIRLLQEGVNI